MRHIDATLKNSRAMLHSLPSSYSALRLRGAAFLSSLEDMGDDKSNAGDLAVELLNVAESLVLAGEDPDDIRAAFVAVLVHMRRQRDQADQDVRDLIVRGLGFG